MTALLELEDVTVRFGANQALTDVDLAVPAGEVVGLIGPNGAGKTTLFNVVTGLQRPTRGTVRFDGADISRLDTHHRARRGIGRTFQRLELFGDLTVRDNVRVAAEIRNRWSLFGIGLGGGRVDVDREVERLLDLLGLRAVADVEAGEVPTGTARLVELGRALIAGPRLVLLDEPASGQTEQETDDFGGLLRHLADEEGLTVLLVEHDMTLVMGVCDRVHVLDFGQVIAHGTPDEVRADDRVLTAYLGAPGA